MKPWQRWWFRLWVRRPWPPEKRVMHNPLDILIIWPAHAYAKLKQHENPSTEGFSHAQKQEDQH